MSFGVFRNKLKNLLILHQVSDVTINKAMALLVETEKTHLVIPRKQLEERAHEYLIDGTMDGIAVSNYIKEELLEESK